MPAFEEMLNLKKTRVHKDGVTCTLVLEPWMLNGNRVVHGGIIATIADEAAWWGTVEIVGRDQPVTTAELKVNYLRAISGAKVTARAVVLKAGRMLVVSRVDIYDERRQLAAHATVSYALVRRGV